MNTITIKLIALLSLVADLAIKVHNKLIDVRLAAIDSVVKTAYARAAEITGSIALVRAIGDARIAQAKADAEAAVKEARIAALDAAADAGAAEYAAIIETKQLPAKR